MNKQNRLFRQSMLMKKRNKMEVEADQVHVEGGRDVRPVM